MGQALGRSINRLRNRSIRLLLKKTPYEGRILALIRVCGEPDWPCLSAPRFELQAASFRNDQAQAQGFAHRMSRLDSPSRSESCRSLEASPPSLRGNYLRSKLQNCSNHGLACGAAPSAAAIRDIPVFEYAPLRVKQAVVGFGRQARNKWPRLLPKCSGCPRLFLSTSPMVWGWLFVTPSPGNPRKRNLVVVQAFGECSKVKPEGGWGRRGRTWFDAPTKKIFTKTVLFEMSPSLAPCSMSKSSSLKFFSP